MQTSYGRHDHRGRHRYRSRLCARQHGRDHRVPVGRVRVIGWFIGRLRQRRRGHRGEASGAHHPATGQVVHNAAGRGYHRSSDRCPLTRRLREGSRLTLRTSHTTINGDRVGRKRQSDQLLIACGGSKAVSITVETPPADRPCSGAGRVCVEIYSISADGTRGVAVAIFVCGYALVANRTRRPAVAVAISGDVLTADPARRIAVPISVGVYGAIAVSACRITRSIRVKAGALGVQRKDGYREHHQRCKNEARHRTPPLLLVRCDDAGR